jgi:hypothetical protein
MPRGPKGERQHADVNRNAVLIARIATDEVTDCVPTPESDGKNVAAISLGRMDGNARAAALGKRKRTEIARKAAKSRWKG